MGNARETQRLFGGEESAFNRPKIKNERCVQSLTPYCPRTYPVDQCIALHLI